MLEDRVFTEAMARYGIDRRRYADYAGHSCYLPPVAQPEARCRLHIGELRPCPRCRGRRARTDTVFAKVCERCAEPFQGRRRQRFCSWRCFAKRARALLH